MGRNFSLTREENNRNIKRENILPDKKSSDIILRFDKIMKEIELKFNLVEELDKNEQFEIRDNILRSQIMFIMSGLDFYMHEIVKYGIISIFKGERKKTKGYENFAINLSCVEKAIKKPENFDWLEESINQRNKISTFMASEKIRCALLIISDNKIISNVSSKMNLTENKLKIKIDDIYNRRNLIAHQSDICEFTGEVKSIDKEYVKEALNTIKNFVKYMHDEIIKDI